MEDDPLKWMPGSFSREPHWRFLHAKFLLATGRNRNVRIDEVWLARACNALRDKHDVGTTDAIEIQAARDLWTEESHKKWELEARLLTDEHFDRLAERMRLSPAVVEAYAHVFFDVREMRQATDWLMVRAVRYSALKGFIGHPLAGAWKLAALHGGPFVLDVVIAATTDRPMPEKVLTGTERIRSIEETRLRFLTRLWVAAVTATTIEEIARVVEAHKQLQGLSLDRATRQRSDNSLTTIVMGFLKSLPTLRTRSKEQDNERSPACPKDWHNPRNTRSPLQVEQPSSTG